MFILLSRIGLLKQNTPSLNTCAEYLVNLTSVVNSPDGVIMKTVPKKSLSPHLEQRLNDTKHKRSG